MSREGVVTRTPGSVASLDSIPLRAVYTVSELARATGRDRRFVKRLLERTGVGVFKAGKVWAVTLSELELKARPIWEAIKAAEMLRHVLDGR